MNIAAVLESGRDESDQNPALLDVGGESRRLVNYEDLRQRVGTLASGFRLLGARTGDRIAILLPNCIEYVEAFFAAASGGYVSVPLNIKLREEELRYMLENSGARVLVAHSSLLEACPLITRMSGLSIIAVGETASGSLDYSNVVATGTWSPICEVESDAGASIMYSSGTTGSPKGILLSHGSWYAVSDLAAKYLDFADKPRTLHTAPLTHGSGFLLIPTLRFSGTNVICDRFDPLRTLSIIDSEQITHGFFVPSMLQMMVDVADKQREPWIAPESLTTVYYAGSPIRHQTLMASHQLFGPRLVQSYAQMECPMFVSVLTKADHLKAVTEHGSAVSGSAGRACEGVHLKIDVHKDQNLVEDEHGELVVRGPQQMLGYWQRPFDTELVLTGGWLHTGDVGTLDPNGYVYVTDRMKDMIISGGVNIYAREVEEVITTHPKVRDVAVIGVPHSKWGEAVVAVIVKSDRCQLEATELHEWLRSNLAAFRCPKEIVFVDALPLNASGKVLKVALRSQFQHIFVDTVIPSS